MNTLKPRIALCALLAPLLPCGSAAAHGLTPSTAAGIVRLSDRELFVAAPTFSAATRTGLVNEQVAITIRDRARKSLVVSASDFALSAQGDVFGVHTWSAGRSRLTVAGGRSLVVRLNFDLPREAANQASLFYRPGGSATSASIGVGGGPAGPRAASPAGQPTINTFSINGVGEPWGTAIDSAGNVWFAEPGCDFAPTCSSSTAPGQIGELNAVSHSVVLYTLPNISGNQPIFLAFDGSGNIWFTTPNNSMIGEFTPATGKFVGQWPVTPGSGPWDLTFAGGKIWYSEHLVSAVGSFDPSTHAYQNFPTPSANANPYGIAANGSLIWFTENNSSVDRVGVLNTTNSNAISEYPIVAPLSGTPHLLVVDPTGHP